MAVMVVRQWKRDGSTNVMRLEAAADNLFKNGLEKMSKEKIGQALQDGGVLETPLARFALHFFGE